MAKGRPWSRDELVVAMNLYCKLPFGQLHERNPVIIKLAEQLGRTSGSVAMKLCNFASLDPVQQARGIKGLSGASQADREVWTDFHKDWDKLAFESERGLAKLEGVPVEKFARIEESELPREGREREAVVKQRVNQGFFRSAVLAAYGGRCCVTGLELTELLVASHVIPWSVSKVHRVNPRNGLCLNSLHDRAFDGGFVTLTLDFRLEVSPRVARAASTHAKDWLLDFDKAPIRLPERFAPDPECIGWHRQHVFQAE
jgi:putative restriction endonuclease